MKELKLTAILLFCLSVLGAWTPPAENTSISFYQGSYDDFLREAKKTHKPILIDFWASWCGPCVKMDKETYSDPKLAAYINENYLIYKVDVDSFSGMEIVQRFDVKAFPTIVIADYRGQEFTQLKGFYPPEYLESNLEDLNTTYSLY